MPENFNFKDKYDITDLLEIMAILRERCPWDREQTHQSIRVNFLEETCEVLEAIDNGDAELLREELGDVLLQVVFHSRIEQEAGRFGFDGVADGVCKKLINRHPHIFGDIKADTADAVLRNWDEIKKTEKSQKTHTEGLMSVPNTLPALMKAAKVQKRAAKAGFDWKNIAGALDKLDEEVLELKKAILQKNDQAIFEEFGDLLFSAVNVSRFIGVEPEQSLGAATGKFIARFAGVEELAAARGIDMASASLEELDRLWDQVKAGAE